MRKNADNIPEIDRDLCRWSMWLAENTTQREKDLVYANENYVKAWLTALEIRIGKTPGEEQVGQLERVNACLERLSYDKIIVDK
jgi:hypothetical protein